MKTGMGPVQESSDKLLAQAEVERLARRDSNQEKTLRLENGHFKVGQKSRKSFLWWSGVRKVFGGIKYINKKAEARLNAITETQAAQEAAAVKKLRTVKALPANTQLPSVKVGQAKEGLKESTFHVVPLGDRVTAPYRDSDSVYQKQFDPTAVPKGQGYVKPTEETFSEIEDREYRLVVDDQQIQKKLASEKQAAIRQMNDEAKSKFKGEPTPFSKVTLDEEAVNESDRGERALPSKKEKIGRDQYREIPKKVDFSTEGSTGVSHSEGKMNYMEDAHLVTDLGATVNGQPVQVHITGVFDGHGGRMYARDEAANFARDHFAEKLETRLKEFGEEGLGDTEIWNAIKIACVDLNHSFSLNNDNSENRKVGTTANLVLNINGDLWVANVGDSRALLVKPGGEVQQLSEDAEPSNEKYEQSIKNRGGVVGESYGKVRVNGRVATARGIGDHQTLGASSARPKIVKLSKPETGWAGYKLVQVCDGVTDVATSKEIGQLVHNSMEQGDSPAVASAKVVERAYHAGSTDNLTALVTQL